MRLRNLERKDAPFMLEWMHDDYVVHDLRTDFKSKELSDCYLFIDKANNSQNDCHLAIVDDQDEYMGTVSLKHIHEKTAEFGITIRRCAMGKNYSYFGMQEIIKHAFEDLRLKIVYWCVDPDNIRALRFYDKHGYSRVSSKEIEDIVTRLGNYNTDEVQRFVWYLIAA